MARCITVFHLPALIVFLITAGARGTAGDTVEEWGTYELRLHGPVAGNPFVDVKVTATFAQGDQGAIEVPGFYDGDGSYCVRFMPPRQGKWTYRTHGNAGELAGKIGEFTCVPPAAANHGPVRVKNTFHFAYEDGTAYLPFGTTCYAWVHQAEILQEQTLATLKQSPFNKLRMCVFPKWYDRNHVEPLLYPFEGTAPNQWDFTRFNPAFFRHLEKRIGELREIGVEADVILFHPYDRGHWGFDRMPSDADERYLRYVIARLSAYRNVWWSLANEFDFMKEKHPEDWDRFFQIVQESDPYAHLRSIHNGDKIYDHNKRWVTHASIQNGSAVADFGRAILYRDVYNKPIVFDEAKYEGNIEKRWGNLSAQEMTDRVWQGAIAGTYVGHGETYRDPQDVLWWAKGGALHGESPARIGFLRKLLDDAPQPVEPVDKWQDDHVAGKPGEYYLIYFGKERHEEWAPELPKRGLDDGARFKVDVIDTWNMTVWPVEEPVTFHAISAYRCAGKGPIKLSGEPYLAIRLRRLP